MKNKKVIILLLVVVFCIVSIISGVTYSYLTFRKEQTDGENIISTVKCLTIKLTNEQNDIKLDKAFAISDEDGKNLQPYSFTVKNECTTNMKISINLENITELDYPKIDDSAIKVYLDGDNVSIIKTLNSYKETVHYLADTEEKSHVLVERILLAKGNSSYKLRLWIDEHATEEQMNKQYKGKIVVTATPFQKNVAEFSYTGSYQEFTAPSTANYQIELWGASGGSENNGGYGGYTKGVIKLNQNEKIYIYVGEQGKRTTEKTGASATFNGGGAGGDPGSTISTYVGGPSGGGATDVRLVSGAWNDQTSLSSRIMVAGGGGGRNDSTTGHAGGLSAYDGIVTNSSWESSRGIKGTQTSGNAFGIGGAGDQGGGTSGYCSGEGGGGGGYYGGTGGIDTAGNCYDVGGGGGSSYISGHTGCVAITSENNLTPKGVCYEGTTDNSCSIHYSGKYFIDTLMIDGAGYTWTNAKASTVGTNLMPDPTIIDGTYTSGQGNIGNGYARITY